MLNVGILFALGALFAWGFSDFFIQKTSRRAGVIPALLFIGLAGLIFIFPFVARDIPKIWGDPKNLLLIGLATLITFFTVLFDFEALKQGKIAIIEPIIGLELPITVGLSLVLRGEHLTGTQAIAVLVIFIGIILAIATHARQLHYHHRILERGVILAGLGAIGLGLTNFVIGLASITVSPLLAIWAIHSLLALICLIYLGIRKELQKTFLLIFQNPGVILGEAVFDNLGWICFASAVIFIPISIATAVSESFIVLATLLGIFINKEKLQLHQSFGIIFAITGILILAYLTP